MPMIKNFSPGQRRALIGLVFIAFLLRLYRIDGQSLWFDESLSALFASQPLSVALQSMLQEGLHHSPLYYILLRPFAAGGFSEFSLRFFSAVLGVLAVPMIAQLGRVAVRPVVGVLAALMLALNPFHLWYSQEARMYTLLIVVAIGAMYYFVRNLTEEARWRYWLGLAFFTAIGINSHHFAFFIPLIQFVFILVTFKQNHHLLRAWFAAQVLAGLSLIPWLLIVLDWGQFYLSSATHRMVTGYDLIQTFWNFSIGYTIDLTPLVVVSLIFFLILFGLGIQAAIRQTVGQLLIIWAVLPPLVTFLISLRLPSYLDRYLSLSLPPFLLLLALGAVSVGSRRARTAVTAGVVLLMLWGSSRVFFDAAVYQRADWRAIGQYLEANAASEDVIAPLYFQDLAPLYFYYHGHTSFEPVIVGSAVQLSVPARKSGFNKMWLILAHPNHSAHLVGHCQPFDFDHLNIPEAVRSWRAEIQPNLVDVQKFTCIRLEVYE